MAVGLTVADWQGARGLWREGGKRALVRACVLRALAVRSLFGTGCLPLRKAAAAKSGRRIRARRGSVTESEYVRQCTVGGSYRDAVLCVGEAGLASVFECVREGSEGSDESIRAVGGRCVGVCVCACVCVCVCASVCCCVCWCLRMN